MRWLNKMDIKVKRMVYGKDFPTRSDLEDWVEDGMGSEGKHIYALKISEIMIEEGIVNYTGDSYELSEDFNDEKFFALWKRVSEKIDKKICSIVDTYQEGIEWKMNDTTYDTFLDKLIYELGDLKDLEEESLKKEIKTRINNLRAEYQ